MLGAPLVLMKVLDMLSCTSHDIPAVHVDEDGNPYSVTEQVLVLSSATSIRCYEGAHTVAAILAVCACIGHMVVFPVLFMWEARSYVSQHGASKAGGGGDVNGGDDGMFSPTPQAAATATARTGKLCHGCVHACRPRVHVRADGLDDMPAYLEPVLKRIYEPSYWYAHWWACGSAMIAAISRSAVALSGYAVAALACHAVVIVSVGICYSTALIGTRPYESVGRWKLPVAVGVNVVAGITAVTQAATAGEASAGMSEALAWISLVASLVLFVILVASFWWMLLEPTARQRMTVVRSVVARKQLSAHARRGSDISFANPMRCSESASSHDCRLQLAGSQSVEARAEALRVLRGKPGSIGEGMRVGDVSASLRMMSELMQAGMEGQSMRDAEQAAVRARREYTKLTPVRVRSQRDMSRGAGDKVLKPGSGHR